MRFLTSMTPDVVVTRLDVLDEATFRGTGVLKLYQELFPPHEQDNPEDIVRWVLLEDIGERRCFTVNGEKISYRLDSRYFILRVAERAIGLGFFTYDYASGLLYGNYVGVHKKWRAGGMARAFYLEMVSMLNELFTDNLGVVIEVERFDRDKLETIIGDLERTGGKRPLDEDEQAEIRKFLRVSWYQEKLNYTFFLDAGSGQPLSCRSPCLDPSLPRSEWAGEEENYWLMWHPRIGPRSAVSDAGKLWRSAVEAIYVEILAKSLVAAMEKSHRRDYWDYARALTEQTLRQGATDVSLATYLGSGDSSLLSRWRDLAIDLPI